MVVFNQDFALGITSVLTIITIGINNRQTLPKISYVNALEIYSLACFTFVLLSFMEFIAVNWFFIEKPLHKIKKEKKRITNSIQSDKVRVAYISRDDI